MARFPGRQLRTARRGPSLPTLVVVVLSLSSTLALVINLSIYFFELSRRTCQPPWKAVHASNVRIALVSLSDTRRTNTTKGDFVNTRNFAGVLEATSRNKEDYCKRHGYTYIDASALLDASRPASWSKLRAVLNSLHDFDWVFWVDADTFITNKNVKVESILPAAASPDFILTKDPGGYNAGMWIVRNGAWSKTFLEEWWGMSSFIRRAPGDTKSGDNDALKYKLKHMDRDAYKTHVGVVPQCTFNSYKWNGSLRNWLRWLRNPSNFVHGLHRRGDFFVHLAGVHDKLSALHGYIETEGQAVDHAPR